jgi:hypothetical protein
MKEPDLENVTGRLEVVLVKERREALTYTLLTVLCTPAFVAISSQAIAGAVLWVMHESDYRIGSAWAIYTGMIVFLAWALAFVTANLHHSLETFTLDRTWLAGAVVFLVLLVLTYATPLQDTSPAFFGFVFVVFSFLVLGLVGQAQINHPPANPLGHAPDPRVFILVVSGFVVSAYGELFSASWLWVPPRPHEIRIAARLLCRVRRIVHLLSRLKLIELADQQLHLTSKGLDFVRAAAKEREYIRREIR